MLVLGIESSCDETSAALVDDQGNVRASVITSQLDIHAKYGGVVPELASRQHIRDLPFIVKQTFEQANANWEDVDGVAATYGPGLMGALLVGLSWAKAAAFARKLPFIGVHHLEGHLLAPELDQQPLPRPFIGLVASGGHTSLYLVTDEEQPYKFLAKTRDDAVGEAFDKVGKLLGLSYPGGPEIEKTALLAKDVKLKFPIPKMKDGSVQFSYSGLKTAVRYYVDKKRNQKEWIDLPEVAAAFQNTIVKDLVTKTLIMAEKYHAKGFVLTGGVAANQALRQGFEIAATKKGLPFYCPPIKWCTDNAAMIAAVGARHLVKGERSPWDLPAVPNAFLGEMI